MKRWPRLLLPALALCGLASCGYSKYGLDELFGRLSPVDERVTDESVPASAAPVVADPENYTFVVVADTHFSESGGSEATARFGEVLGEIGAEFVLVVGDLVHTGLPAEYASYAAWTADLGVPVYSAVGNHDLYNEGWSSFRELVGPCYYSFAVGARSFYVVDSGNGTLGRVQLEMLRDDFSGDGNPKVVVCHYPVYNGSDTTYYELTNTAERAAVIDLYASSGVELILEGHTHTLAHTRLGGMDEWVCASIGGESGQVRCIVVAVSAGSIASVTGDAF